MFYNSANRDERAFDDPYRFDVHAHAERARRLRRRRPALLPRRQPRPPRDQGDVRGAVPPPARHRDHRRARLCSRATSSTASSACRAPGTPSTTDGTRLRVAFRSEAPRCPTRRPEAGIEIRTEARDNASGTASVGRCTTCWNPGHSTGCLSASKRTPDGNRRTPDGNRSLRGAGRIIAATVVIGVFAIGFGVCVCRVAARLQPWTGSHQADSGSAHKLSGTCDVCTTWPRWPAPRTEQPRPTAIRRHGRDVWLRCGRRFWRSSSHCGPRCRTYPCRSRRNSKKCRWRS